MVKQFTIAALISGVTILSAPLMAQDEEPPPEGWRGSGELGYVKTSGNTETSSLNLALEFIYEKEKWRHTLGATALRSKKSGTVDAERYTLSAQSDYKFNEKSYLFGAFRHDADEFAGYNPVTTLSAGYGRELVNTEKHFLLGEVGAGYRRQEVALTGESENGAIFRGRLDYRWTVTATTEFGNQFLVEAGSDNTFIQNDTNLSVAINSAFAVKLAYLIRYNTDPPAFTDDTDTQFTTNLVYSF
jgi:putative salt-induced outer membrane protein